MQVLCLSFQIRPPKPQNRTCARMRKLSLDCIAPLNEQSSMQASIGSCAACPAEKVETLARSNMAFKTLNQVCKYSRVSTSSLRVR